MSALLLALCRRVHSNPAVTIYQKIVAWWEMDEPSGTTMTDSHTNALNGTYSGVTVNQSPIFTNLGKSIAMTGASNTNNCSVSDNSLLKPTTTDFAVMVTVKRNGSQGNFPKFVWKEGGNNASGQANYLLQQDNFSNGGKALFRVTASGVNYDVLTSSALADATGYQLIGQFTTRNLISITRNAVQENTTALPNNSSLQTAATALKMGYNGSANDSWVGNLDQCVLFNANLQQAEINYLYNSGLGVSYATLKAAAGH